MTASGKDCFRLAWKQDSVYSGGPISGFAAVGRVFLATSFGHVLNVIDASTGSTVARFETPLEDPILHIEVVSSIPQSDYFAARSFSSYALQPKIKPMKYFDHFPEFAHDADPRTPRASAFVAFSTQALQIYVLAIEIPLKVHEEVIVATKNSRASTEIFIVEEFHEDNKEKLRILQLNRDDLQTISVKLHTVQQWTASQHAIGCLKFTSGLLSKIRNPSIGCCLACGSTDGNLQIWDLDNYHLSHNYKYPQGGSISVISFGYANSSTPEIIVVGTFTGYVSLVEFSSKRVLASKQSHTATIVSIATVLLSGKGKSDQWSVCSVGRDRKAVLYTPGTLDAFRTIAIHDEVCTAMFASSLLNAKSMMLYVGATTGAVATYRADLTGSFDNTDSPPPVLSLIHRTKATTKEMDEDSIASILPLPFIPLQKESVSLNCVAVADNAQRITFYKQDPNEKAAPLEPVKVLAGFLDQVFDVKPLPLFFQQENKNSTNFIARAVATNAKDVLLFDSPGSFAKNILKGHTDMVVSLQVSPCGQFLASGSKDCTIRLWDLKGDCSSSVAVFEKGHTSDVSAISFRKNMAPLISFVSGGVDNNIRIWRFGNRGTPGASLESIGGQTGAHNGAVLCLDCSPSGTSLASGGKDKVIILWSIEAGHQKKGATKKEFLSLRKQFVLQGHRRAVNCVRFSPIDKLLASASGDGSTRIWSVINGACLKTLQVDSRPVGVDAANAVTATITSCIQCSFFNEGTQLAVAMGDGLLRFWSIAAGEVVATVDNAHSDKVWSMSVIERKFENHLMTVLLTGSADGTISAVEDFTDEKASELQAAHVESVEKCQAFENALRRGDYKKAFILAAQLGYQRSLRRVVTEWNAKAGLEGCEDGIAELCAEIFSSTNDSGMPLDSKKNQKFLQALLEATQEWLTNARHTRAASVVLSAIFRVYHPNTLEKMPVFQRMSEVLLSYSQRHVHRLTTLQDQLRYVDWTTRSLRPASGALAAALNKEAEVQPASTGHVKKAVSKTTAPKKSAKKARDAAEPSAKKRTVER